MASTSRPAIALARPPGVRLNLRLSRVALIALLTVAIAGLAYALARTTSLFAVRSVEVTGAPISLARQVEAKLARFRGQSLVGLDARGIEAAVESIPAVKSAEIERDFPRTLRVDVRPEVGVAVARRAEDAWLVAASGKVLEQIQLGTFEGLPRIWLARTGEPVSPSTVLSRDTGGAAAEAVAELPRSFPVKVLSVHGTGRDLTLMLRGGTELRLGEPVDIGLKLAVAATVLRGLPPEGGDSLAYLDVSLPARPVGLPKSQVEA